MYNYLYVNMPRYCKKKNCKSRAAFGKKGGRATRCKDHKLKNYIDVIHPKCISCKKKRPIFGKVNEKATHCKDCAPEDYVDVIHKKCETANCDKRAHYGKPETTIRKFCKKDAPKGYKCLGGKLCEGERCDKRATFGDPEVGIAKYCTKHKLEGYIDVKNKKCKKCDKVPTFGIPGTQTAEYCTTHKLEGYIDIRNKTCKICDKVASFGEPETKTAIFCSDHAPKNYVDVKSKKCKKCDSRASYGDPKTKMFEYCTKHKLKGYINLRSKRCKEEGCDKIPTFGIPGTKIKVFCKKHKLSNYVDVAHPGCKKCSTRARFGPLFQETKHCAKHKNNNEFRKNKPKCESTSSLETDKSGSDVYGKACKEVPVYTDKGSIYPLRCEEHKLENDINIIEKKCSSCQLMWIIPNDKTMCNACGDFNNLKIRNRKENKIKVMLEANKIKYESHDKIVDSICSYKRPDFVLDYNYYKVIVEVDENQHSSYPCECEQSRMVQIHQDIGMDLVFIRFNPDNYENNGGETIKSYASREKKLLELLNALKNTKYRKNHLEVIYLYYDGWDEAIHVEPVNYFS